MESLSSPYHILVHPRQQRNPVFKLRHKLHINFSEEAVADFQFSETSCGLFISLRFLRHDPRYLPVRMAEVPLSLPHRVLVCLVDEDSGDIEEAISDLDFMCCFEKFILLLAYSKEDVIRYLESLSSLTSQDIHLVRDKSTYASGSNITTHTTLAEAALTSLPTVSKTDAFNMMTAMKTMKNVIEGKVFLSIF